jgi:hypothetical protein
MLREMRPSGLGLWAAMHSIDPWGEERDDLRAGVVAATIANVHRGKGTEPYSPLDFVLGRKRKEASLKERLINFLRRAPQK